MAVHKPGAVWPLRSITYPAWVRTANEEYLQISVIDPGTIHSRTFEISRSDARLLAKRINACLAEIITPKAV